MINWKWVISYAEKQLQNTEKVSCKCPNCKTWTYLMPDGMEWKEIDDRHDDMTCSRCGYISRWDVASYPLPIFIGI